MKSNVINFKKGEDNVQQLLVETEKVAIYNGLNAKESLRLRLLSEEVSGILRELVQEFDGEFWIENENKVFTINFSVKADSMDEDTKKKLLSVSSSGKNELAKGFMGKLRSLIEFFATGDEHSQSIACLYGFYQNTTTVCTINNDMLLSVWSLEKYKADVKDKKEWDELEKSIVANLADDVTVGVMGKKVVVAVKKTF